MIARSMIAGAALLALTTGTVLAAPPAAKGSHKDYTDRDGNTLAVDFDDQGKVTKTKATDKDKKDLPVTQIPMASMTVCIPASGAGAGATLCQPLTFLSDGAFLKMGTASCWCGNLGGVPVCYGGNCK